MRGKKIHVVRFMGSLLSHDKCNLIDSEHIQNLCSTLTSMESQREREMNIILIRTGTEQ